MLTKTKREALKRARAMVKCHDEEFICNALDTVKMNHPRLRPACERLKKYIERMLDGHAALGSWQKANVDPLRNARSTAAMRRVDRLMWIDWMLGWQPHEGGECPENLRSGMSIEVRFRNGGTANDTEPGGWRWNHTPTGRANRDFDIVAYRLL